jgi:predicted membrane protein
MKKNISREEAKKSLVYDPYFERGNYKNKIFQTGIALLGWFGVMIPFFWILFPFIFTKQASRDHITVYKDEKSTLIFLFYFLLVAFVFIAILYVILTSWNNYRFKNFLQKSEQFDSKRLETRKKLINKVYDERFSSKEYRHNISYYSVKEEQNLETDFVQKLYQKGENND